LGILVKIFDVGDGSHIPVHWHPTPEFSRRHLNSPYGKNETWIIIGTRPGAKAWIGWKEDVEKDDFIKWMEKQDVQEMRKHLHEVSPKVDDVFYLRAGIVHSLGSGLCILEPQEPTDWNILAEWEGFPYEKEDGNLDLGWDLAMESAGFSEMSLDYLHNYVMRNPVPLRQEKGGVEYKLLPDDARQFFWVTRLNVKNKINMANDQGFYCAVTLKGNGKISGSFGEIAINKGKSVFVHASSTPFKIINEGGHPLDIICCYPPKSK
jgi:mannose-6-phosphate isomerase